MFPCDSLTITRNIFAKMEVHIHVFLNSALDGSRGLLSGPVIKAEGILCRHWIRRGMVSAQKRNIHSLCWKSKYWHDSGLFDHIFSLSRKIAKSEHWFSHVCLSILPSSWNSWAATGRIFVYFDIGLFFRNIYEF